jgi:hypothetical protein
MREKKIIVAITAYQTKKIIPFCKLQKCLEKKLKCCHQEEVKGMPQH